MRTVTASRLWLLKLAMLAVSVGMALLCIEVFLRVSGRGGEIVWSPDPHVGWWHVPGSRTRWTQEGDGLVEINSVGLRDVERTVEKPPGVYRVAVFGDSMTEGVQVNLDQSFTQLLERQLRARAPRVEVLNFGVNGYSALQSYLLYQRVGKDFNPDLVLHAVFLDNDIADGDPELATGQHGAPTVIGGTDDRLQIDYTAAQASFDGYHREPMHSAREWFATYRVLSAMRWSRMDADRYAASTASTGGIPRRYMVYADPLEARWERASTTFERIVDAFAEEVKSAGSHFALLSVPAGQVVDETVWERIRAQNPAMNAVQWDIRGPQQRLHDWAAQRGLVLLEPVEAFRTEPRSDPLFFGGVGHLTPAGHRVMAAFLEQSLEKLGLLPAPVGSGERQ